MGDYAEHRVFPARSVDLQGCPMYVWKAECNVARPGLRTCKQCALLSEPMVETRQHAQGPVCGAVRVRHSVPGLTHCRWRHACGEEVGIRKSESFTIGESGDQTSSKLRSGRIQLLSLGSPSGHLGWRVLQLFTGCVSRSRRHRCRRRTRARVRPEMRRSLPTPRVRSLTRPNSRKVPL